MKRNIGKQWVSNILNCDDSDSKTKSLVLLVKQKLLMFYLNLQLSKRRAITRLRRQFDGSLF